MGKVLVKKVRFVQKESSPQECYNTSERTFSERICTIGFLRRESCLKLKCAT